MLPSVPHQRKKEKIGSLGKSLTFGDADNGEMGSSEGGDKGGPACP